MSDLKSVINTIQETISKSVAKSGRHANDVRIVAVSKTRSAEAVQEVYDAGLLLFGENRIQEAEDKIAQLKALNAEWHYIGRLQTNKVKKAIQLFNLIHSVDRPKLLKKIDHEAAIIGKSVSILLQINIGGEASKSGVEIKEIEGLLDALHETSHVQCHGLMTIPPYEPNPEDARKYFIQLRKLGERYKSDIVRDGQKLELSMGMSHDYHLAIEEGATLVRIGTAIFGMRDYH